MSESMKYTSKLSIGGTVVEFVSCEIADTRELLLDTEGVSGTRSLRLERACQGLIHVGGPIKMNPTPAELALVWPFCVQNSTGTTLMDALQDVTVIHDQVAKKYTWLGRFNKLRISGRPGKKLDLTLDFLGYSSTIASGSSLSGTPDLSVRPYMMQDIGSGITIGGTTYPIDEVDFEIDNKIEPTFMQGQVATDLEPSGREVTVSVRLRNTTTEAPLLVTAQAGPVLGTPVSGTLAFTNGTNSVSLAFGAMIAQPKSVVVGNEKKLRLPLTYKCLQVGTTKEVVATFT